jgi:hypothetical protein
MKKSLAFLMFVIAACDGGGDDGKSTAELKADWDKTCVDRATECPERSNDPEHCKAEFPCLSTVFRPDMLEKIVACEDALTCEQGDDDCYSLEAQGLTPSAKAAKFKTDCLAKVASCQDQGDGAFKDDFCYVTISMTDGLVGAIDTCLASACSDVGDCFEAKLTEIAPACTK